jgi:hypothetical protein
LTGAADGSRQRVKPPNGTAGYSGTPLAKKLGITAGCKVLCIDAPADYRSRLEPIPDGVTFTSRAGAGVDLAHLFVTERGRLAKELAALRSKLRPETPVWVSWPKKASGVTSSVTEDVIREMALPIGYVDVKVCAVSEVWSGLKVVVRKELR